MSHSVHIPAERPEWGEEAAVVVPKIERIQQLSASIDPGSGIVAFQMRGMPEKIHAYYEGNRHGAQNMVSFEDRVMHAYGRMTKRYPTIAESLLDIDDFDVVGVFTNEYMDIDKNHPALLAWVAADARLQGRIETAKVWKPHRNMGRR